MRLGDVVMAAPNREGQRFIYQYCQAAEVVVAFIRLLFESEKHQVRETGEAVFETKSWCPPELSLQLLGEQLQQEVTTCSITNDCIHFSCVLTLCTAGPGQFSLHLLGVKLQLGPQRAGASLHLAPTSTRLGQTLYVNRGWRPD